MIERFKLIYKFNIKKDFINCPVGIDNGAILFDEIKNSIIDIHRL